MKRTKRRDEMKRLNRMNILCRACGQAPAVRFDRIGRAVCGKAHRRKKVSRIGI